MMRIKKPEQVLMIFSGLMSLCTQQKKIRKFDEMKDDLKYITTIATSNKDKVDRFSLSLVLCVGILLFLTV